MKVLLALHVFALALTGVAEAQRPSSVVGSDARIRQIDYFPGQVFAVTATLGYQLTINLAPDERILTVALGDTSAFQVTASRSGSALFVKALQAGALTNMTVTTDVRKYTFTLSGAAATSDPTPYTVEFRYPRPPSIQPLSNRPAGTYKLGGNKALWPTRISDDGEHVFIDWSSDTDLPAVYALDGQGQESLTNGMMRNGHMVIDAIAPKLVFRLDHVTATAVRYVPKARAR